MSTQTAPAADVDIVAELAAIRLTRICGRTITPVQIRKWASRGAVERRGRQGRAVLYSMNELQAYADRLYTGSNS